MPGQSILGQNTDCCNFCGFVNLWPNIIYVTMSGLIDCGCIGNQKIDYGSNNGMFSLSKSTAGVWSNTNIGSIAVTTYDNVNCSGTSNTQFQTATCVVEAGLVAGQCEITIAGTALGFDATITIPPSTPLESIPNTFTCPGSVPSGTATISLDS